MGNITCHLSFLGDFEQFFGFSVKPRGSLIQSVYTCGVLHVIHLFSQSCKPSFQYFHFSLFLTFHFFSCFCQFFPLFTFHLHIFITLPNYPALLLALPLVSNYVGLRTRFFTLLFFGNFGLLAVEWVFLSSCR